jgi:hypothetical protein
LQNVDFGIELFTTFFKKFVLQGRFSAAATTTTTVKSPVTPRRIGEWFSFLQIFEKNLFLRGDFLAILVFKVDFFIGLLCVEFTDHAVFEGKCLKSGENFT